MRRITRGALCLVVLLFFVLFSSSCSSSNMISLEDHEREIEELTWRMNSKCRDYENRIDQLREEVEHYKGMVQYSSEISELRHAFEEYAAEIHMGYYTTVLELYGERAADRVYDTFCEDMPSYSSYTLPQWLGGG